MNNSMKWRENYYNRNSRRNRKGLDRANDRALKNKFSLTDILARINHIDKEDFAFYVIFATTLFLLWVAIVISA